MDYLVRRSNFETRNLGPCLLLLDLVQRWREARMRGSFVLNLGHVFITIENAEEDVVSKFADITNTSEHTQQFPRECAGKNVVSTRCTGNNKC